MKTLSILLASATVAAVLAQHASANAVVATPHTAKVVVESNLNLTTSEEGHQVLAINANIINVNRNAN